LFDFRFRQLGFNFRCQHRRRGGLYGLFLNWNGDRLDLINFYSDYFFHWLRDNLYDFSLQFFAEDVRKPVLDRVGVRRDGHTHVLQFADHFGVVEV